MTMTLTVEQYANTDSEAIKQKLADGTLSLEDHYRLSEEVWDWLQKMRSQDK